MDEFNGRDYRILAARGVAAQAVATRIVDHGRVTYTFVVAGSQRQGTGVVDWPNPPVHALTSGEQVSILYDPQEPQRTCACSNPQDHVQPHPVVDTSCSVDSSRPPSPA